MSIDKSKPMATLDFYGCPMHCKYCSHMVQEKNDYTIDQVKSAVSDYDIHIINFAGAEPAMQKGEVLQLIKVLKKMGKEIWLRTLGNDPDFLKETLPYVSRYMLEIKVPLDDPATLVAFTNYDDVQAREYLDRLKHSLVVLKDAKVEAIIRVVPGFFDEQRIERIALDLKDKVTEVHLLQFLSYPYDVPFRNIIEPSPSEGEMMSLGKVMRKFIQSVRVQGNGFDHGL